MISRSRILPLLALVAVLAGPTAGCELLSVEPRDDVAPEKVSLADAAVDTFQVAYGKTLEVQETGLRLRLEDVQDSRCAADVVCITEGAAILSFVAEQGDDTERFQLSLPGLVEVPYDRNETVTVLGHRLKLLRVDPYPYASNPQGKEAYRALLSIEQAK